MRYTIKVESDMYLLVIKGHFNSTALESPVIFTRFPTDYASFTHGKTGAVTGVSKFNVIYIKTTTVKLLLFCTETHL